MISRRLLFWGEKIVFVMMVAAITLPISLPESARYPQATQNTNAILGFFVVFVTKVAAVTQESALQVNSRMIVPWLGEVEKQSSRREGNTKTSFYIISQ